VWYDVYPPSIRTTGLHFSPDRSGQITAPVDIYSGLSNISLTSLTGKLSASRNKTSVIVVANRA
jgi:hypothetical protein